VVRSAAQDAANTPWTEKMRPHFRDHLRFECRRYPSNWHVHAHLSAGAGLRE
jgi:hypothetical protein